MNAQFGILPIILFFFGLLVFLVLVVLKFCSSFCCEISCRPKISPHMDVDVIHKRINNQIARLSKYYYFICFLIIVASQIIVTQRDNLMKGAAGMQAFINTLNEMFNNLASASADLVASSVIIESAIDSATTCVDTLDASSLTSSAVLFNEQIEPTRIVFTNLGAYLDKGLGNTTYLEAFIWGSYGLLFLYTALLAYLNYCRNKFGVKVFTLLAGFAYLVTLLMATIFLCVTMVLANTCMNPYQDLIDSSPPSVSENLEYYFTCEGTNVMFENSVSANNEVVDLIASLATITAANPSCATNSNYLAIQGALVSAATTIVSAGTAIPCTDVKSALSSFIDTALCNRLYRFSGGLWVCFQMSSLLMLIVIVIGTINAQYYKSKDRRKIAANIMDLDGIIPGASDSESFKEVGGGGSSWGRGRGGAKGGKTEKMRIKESKDLPFEILEI
jgi:hypothetical protein